jgi:hypothetical protein
LGAFFDVSIAALVATGPRHAHDSLWFSYLELGRFDEAIAEYTNGFCGSIRVIRSPSIDWGLPTKQ